MNIIFALVLAVSIACLVFTAPELVLSAMLSGSNSAILLAFELLAIYAVWLGVLGIVENTPISKVLAKMLSPLINLLWGKNLNKEAKNYLALSLSVQVLGIGGASVPFGIKAIEKMDDKSGSATFPMIMTIIFASSGVQLIPSTVMSLMQTCGSSNPSFIILPTILSGLCTTIVGVVLTILLEKFFGRKNNDKPHTKQLSLGENFNSRKMRNCLKRVK